MRKRKQRLTESFLAVDMTAVALAWMAAYYARFDSTLFTTVFPPYKGIPLFRDYVELLPLILGLAAIVFAMQDSPYSMHVAMVTTFWISAGRLIRGEVIKLRGLEYVEAAHSIGVPDMLIIFRHILPNTSHILLVQATITFVAAIKSEVILSFLGLGVKDGMSWGLMIAESTQEVLAGFFNNFLAASVLLFGLVMAFNMFADALQDALDPRKVG